MKFKNLNGSEKINLLLVIYLCITCSVRINFLILITYDSFPNFPFLVLLWNLFYGFSMQLLQAYLSYTHTPHHLELILWLKVCNRYDGFFETMFKEIKMHFLYFFCNFLFYVKRDNVVALATCSWRERGSVQEMYCIFNFFILL